MGSRGSAYDRAKGLSEVTSYPHEVQETALAHVIKNKAEAAYRRGDLFEKRRSMMLEWANFCDGLVSSN